jgi:hypothetical protein
VPVDWGPTLKQRHLATAIKTELASPDGEKTAEIIEEAPTPPVDRVDHALSLREQEDGYASPSREARTLGNRDAVFFSYEIDEKGIGPATIVNYAFNAGGSGWRTRAAVAGTTASSASLAEEVATRMASTLKPR